jgi:hypothetical protein
MGKSESAERSLNRIEARQEHNFSRRQKENRSRSAGAVGEGEGAAEEGGVEQTEPVCGDRRFGWGYGSGLLGNQEDILCGCLTGTECMELLTKRKSFFFNEWEALGPFPRSPNLPLPACLTL